MDRVASANLVDFATSTTAIQLNFNAVVHSQESQLMTKGSCLCGAIEFQISGTLNKIQACHCQQCRKAQGTPFATNLPVAVEHFTITKGNDVLKEFKSQTREGKYRLFCSHCGSPIISRMESLPDVVRVRAGTLDEPVVSELAHHQFVADKASWWNIDDELPRHHKAPPD